MSTHEVELAKLIVSAIGLGGTLVAVLVGLSTFLRNEKWKRAEYLSREMKAFMDKPKVQTTLTLIDWGARTVTLLGEDAPNKGKVPVTRFDQVLALLPHTLVGEKAGSEMQHMADNPDLLGRYSPEQAAIRDCYDAFLDGLERFSCDVQTGLLSVRELEPYLRYWIEAIQSPVKDGEDAAWAAVLLTYIQYYRFFGVQWLFNAFGRNIDPSGDAYKTLLSRMKDRRLAVKLAAEIGVEWSGSETAGKSA